MGALWLISMPLCAWWLPGWAASRWLYPRSTPLERLGSTVLLGPVLTVPLTYLFVYGLRTPMTPSLILGVGITVALGLLATARFRPRRSPVDAPGAVGGHGWGAAAGVVAIALVTTTLTTPKSLQAGVLFAPCLHESALTLLEDGTGGGLVCWDPVLGAAVEHVTARDPEPAYGLSHILGHQRPGSMATMAPIFALHGSGGLAVATFCYDLLVAALAALLIAARAQRTWAVLLLCAGFMTGLRTIAGYAVNENMLALGLGLGTLRLLLRGRSSVDAAAAAVCFALCAAVRPSTVTFLPGLLLLLPRRPLPFAVFAGVGLAASAPWFWTNSQAFETALFHPSLILGQHHYSVLGLEFQFHPLNWPIADTLLIGSGDALPQMLAMPLEHMRAFGAVLVALAATGLVALGRRSVPLVLIALPNYLVLALIVSLDYEKLSHALLSFVPLPVLLGAGIGALLEGTMSLPRRLGAALLAAALLIGWPLWAGSVDAAIDPRRQYHTTRRANPIPIDELRGRLLSPTLLPALDYWPAPQVEQAPGMMWSLLSNGGPPQREANLPVQAPAMLWLNQHKTVSLRVRATAEPGFHGILSESTGCTTDRALAGFTWFLDGGADAVQVDALLDRLSLEFHLKRGSGTRAGYVSLVFHNTNLDGLRFIRVTLDGVEQRPHLITLDRTHARRDPDRLIRVITNYAWHAGLLGGGTPVLRPGTGRDDGCYATHVGPSTIGVSPGVLRIDQRDQSCRIGPVPAMDRNAEDACLATELRIYER